MHEHEKKKYGIKEIKVKNNMVTVNLMVGSKTSSDQVDMQLKYVGKV